MDQISPPMRIVLAVAVVFLAAWMLVLKPKSDTSEPAATPATPATASAQDANRATTGLGKAVEAARGAKDATEAEQDKEGLGASKAGTAPSTSAATATDPATKSAPKRAGKTDPALAELPGWLQRSMDRKVIAILFTNRTSADDRRTARALRRAFTAHGQVVKRAVPLSRIARYRPVAAGVDVQQSPTLMVIDRDRSAQALVGYSSVDTINQAIVDGLLATDVPVKHSAYLQAVRTECTQISNAIRIGETGGGSFSGAKRNLDHIINVHASSLGALRNAPVPAKYKPLSRLVNRFLASQGGLYRTVRSVAVGAKSIDTVEERSILRRNDRLQRRTSIELAAVGVNACT